MSTTNEGTAPGAATQEAFDALMAELQRDATAFDFFALMRRVDALRQHQPRTGEALRPRQEALRLGQAPELAGRWSRAEWSGDP